MAKGITDGKKFRPRAVLVDPDRVADAFLGCRSWSTRVGSLRDTAVHELCRIQFLVKTVQK